MKSIIEESLHPTIHLLYPWLETVKLYLENLSLGVHSGRTAARPHLCAQELAKCTIQSLERIEVHDFWLAGCVFHPGLRLFSFVRRSTDVVDVKDQAYTIIRRMMSEYEEEHISGASINPNVDTITGSDEPFNLNDAMSFSERVDHGDDLSAYLEE